MVIDRSKVLPKRLQAGTSVKGTIEYRKGRENNRGLEVEVKWQDGSGSSAEQIWFLK
jgi:hypothetical protein